jgi:hypothetical protein
VEKYASTQLISRFSDSSPVQGGRCGCAWQLQDGAAASAHGRRSVLTEMGDERGLAEEVAVLKRLQTVLSEAPVEERRRVAQLLLLLDQIGTADHADGNLLAESLEKPKSLERHHFAWFGEGAVHVEQCEHTRILDHGGGRVGEGSLKTPSPAESLGLILCLGAVFFNTPHPLRCAIEARAHSRDWAPGPRHPRQPARSLILLDSRANVRLPMECNSAIHRSTVWC